MWQVWVIMWSDGFDRIIGCVVGERCKNMDYREAPEENLRGISR